MRERRYMTGAEGLILVGLALALAIWLVWPKTAGAQAVLERSGEVLDRYDLSRPVRVPVEGANGFSLTLVIEEGKAWVEDSTCPDLICQHHAPVSKSGEAIVCLPGQVSVTIEGGGRHGPDAVAG